MSKLETNTIDTISGSTTLTLGGTNANAITIPSGVTLSGTDIALSGNIGLGGATPTTSGTGITFPATQSASTDANTLDDYEEGTWTPVIADATSGGNEASGTAVNARYIKIGRVVHYNILYTNVNTTGLTSGNTAYIRGFPFTTQTVSGGMEMNSIATVNSASPTTGCITLNLGSNRTYGILVNQTTSGQVAFLVSQLTSGTSDFFIQGTYFTN